VRHLDGVLPVSPLFSGMFFPPPPPPPGLISAHNGAISPNLWRITKKASIPPPHPKQWSCYALILWFHYLDRNKRGVNKSFNFLEIGLEILSSFKRGENRAWYTLPLQNDIFWKGINSFFRPGKMQGGKSRVLNPRSGASLINWPPGSGSGSRSLVFYPKDISEKTQYFDKQIISGHKMSM
jgi:hypothetical protein